MIYHIITAAIRSPMTIVAARHQYDYGQALSITGITLPDVFEAHFATVDGTQTVTMLGHNGVVEIPDELFQVAKAIVCYIYLHDEATDGRTVYTIKIPVKERPKPSDVEPTPVQQDIITQAIATLNDAVEQTAADVSHYPKVIDGTWHIYDAESESWVDTGDAAQGPKGDTGETGATGPKGDKGDKGDQGIQGIQGVQGEKGDKGDKGDTGEKGDKGDPGEVTLADFYKAFATDTAIGAIAHFTDGADSIPMKDVLVHIEPVQAGSGDPSPDNVRAITGWTGAKVTRTGKNLLPNTAVTSTVQGVTYTVNADGSISANGTSTGWHGLKISEFTLGAGQYKLTSGVIPAQRYYSYFSLLNGSVEIANTSNAGTKSLTISEDITLTCKLFSRPGAVLNNVMNYPMILLESDADTTYAPFVGYDIYDITFPSEAGTVYGGTLDVTKGELVVDRAQIASYNGEALPSTWISDRDVYVSGTTPTIGAQVVYKLASPITYHLTPQEITSLLGTNNLWADTGDSEVEYMADTTLYISRLTEPDADMIADANIVSGQYFMVGNNLYRATSNIASGASVVVGTNAVKVSLATALNEINQ